MVRYREDYLIAILSDPTLGVIYAYTCLPTGNAYVGQTLNYPFRQGRHLNRLRKRTHHNGRLQAAFNQHGEGQFIFEVLEICEPDEGICRLLEAYWIRKLNTLDPAYGFNIIMPTEYHDVMRVMSRKYWLKRYQMQREGRGFEGIWEE